MSANKLAVTTKKKKVKRETRKTIFGIKLPPIEADDSAGNVKTILDIDSCYFSLVEGRPIRPNTSINKYKQDIKEVALKRALHGFITDEIFRINREIESERDIYETATKHFDEYQNSFDKFLADDNNKTITIMQKSDNMAKDLGNITEDHKKANYELASMKSKLQYIDETLLILHSFEKFLHKTAPILWQESNNITVADEDEYSEIFSVDTNIYRKIDIKSVKSRLEKLSEPRLYFEKPEQLITVFDALEKQNLNYLLVTEELNSQKNKFLKTLGLLKQILRQELDYIQLKIKGIEDIIAWNEMREIEVKEVFFKILEEKMRSLIASDTALQIFNCVEFAYEKLIAPNETKLSTLELTLYLEREYENLLLDLSAYDLEILKQIEKQTYEKSAEEIRRAKHASKLLKEVDKLGKRLKSAYEPSRNKSNY